MTLPFVMHGLWCTHRDCFSDVTRKSDDQILQEMIDFYLYAIRPQPENPEFPAGSRITLSVASA